MQSSDQSYGQHLLWQSAAWQTDAMYSKHSVIALNIIILLVHIPEIKHTMKDIIVLQFKHKL